MSASRNNGTSWPNSDRFLICAPQSFGTLTDRHSFQLAAPLLGVGDFVYSPLLAVMVAERAGPALAGSATGVTSACCWQLGSVIVPLAVGLVFQMTNSFLAAFAVLAAGPLLGAVCMLFVPEQRPAR